MPMRKPIIGCGRGDGDEVYLAIGQLPEVYRGWGGEKLCSNVSSVDDLRICDFSLNFRRADIT